MKTAIFIDTAFLIQRLRQYLPQDEHYHAQKIAESAINLALKHTQYHQNSISDELYRIYFYDCPPIDKKVHKPISRELLDLSKTKEAIFRRELHQLLQKQPKTLLRLGELSVGQDIWRLKTGVAKDLLWGKRQWYDLTDGEFVLDLHQKGVGIQMGADLMSLTLKKQVDKVVIVSNDDEFTLVADSVRYEGVHLVLDSMHKTVHESVFGHIDELWTTFTPKKRY